MDMRAVSPNVIIAKRNVPPCEERLAASSAEHERSQSKSSKTRVRHAPLDSATDSRFLSVSSATNAPTHYVTRRYAEFAASILALHQASVGEPTAGSSEGTGDEMLLNNL